MNFYIMHMVLLVIILLFLIAIICYHYPKHRSKQKTYCCIYNMKINNELKKSQILLKIVHVVISMI